MRRWCFYIFALCCFLFLAVRPYGEIFYLETKAAEAAGLADSAWPCKGYNAQRTGQSPYSGAQTNTLKWTYTTADWIYSSPALGTDGTIYFGGCDENDGEFFDKIYARAGYIAGLFFQAILSVFPEKPVRTGLPL